MYIVLLSCLFKQYFEHTLIVVIINIVLVIIVDVRVNSSGESM